MWNDLENYFDKLPPIFWNLLLTAIALLAGFIFKVIITFFSRYYAKRSTKYSLFYSVLSRIGRPLNFFLPVFIFNLMLPLMRLSDRAATGLDRIVGILIIVAFALLLIGVIKVIEDYINSVFDLSKADNLKERKIRTQLQFVRKFVVSIIIILAGCAILLSFPHLRKIGTGLLTGVGIGGIIIGFAAQRSLANFLAGLQIAFTQPMRIDDVLIVEGEWGRVEEITLTYVVLNIWDKRRLILPINYFIEKPFQNWTRNSAELLGTVFIYLDYTAPMNALREEYSRLLKANELWDGNVNVVQITDAKERVIEVRFLMSATTSGRAFDLRCYIRENMIRFIQENYPEALPKTRAIIEEKQFKEEIRP
ncbi:mechanosensitive ion channel family protein [Chitinophaga horti]|uniref:Mechanosensitive ion channel family protein n=1 Tax=Chitinophaga horti TaxID=2920382 RepID=A0ABY6IXV5_9BACT|nr:mechanosensitive ion channel family protein [Chitinophaga horti]UYQ92225.1 mechanosensitive ion channel family protein [Chitinophaga horti]